MKKVAIVGSQWGDEGKGKVVNYFSSDFEWIVRFSGGSNAGHTIYHKGKKYVNHLLPSIVPDSDSKGFLGAGMVIDLEQLIKELNVLENDFPGISSKFYIDLEAFIVLPWHKEEDELIESMRREPIGTTKRGIGPAYTDKVSREGIKLYHIFDDEVLKSRLEDIYYLKNNIYSGRIKNNAKDTYEYLLKQREDLKKLKVNYASAVEMGNVFRSTSVLFEGAQGVLLDLDFGTYPFVTSGACMAHGVSSVGFSTFELDEVYGVLKAYTTRVGEGPFPTELFGEEADKMRKLGNEFGATTGRPRRVGWLDLPAMRYAKIRSGLTSIVITKADVLNGYDKIKVCTSYEVDGEVKDIPSSSADFFKAKPIYEELDGWQNTNEVNFLKYMTYIEENTGIKIDYISYGPKTEEMCSKNSLILDM
ncbi:adenylosuccinate synthase [Oceanotoga sp. DSM 15011]|uniref:Adenylosuccinate synthetase n=1 Tax=Oceanotoga teriensis TaxID=515440 RepID=A0AA45C8J0_9BACT|nr:MULTISPECIES: adenylosuccinate synthase [Oceanotoga]MDN5343804.1 adenylosuccinate synthase [Oceanotoga sp.]MDO7975557.1 adenylosuccinate synthase [Oceanotoga teriensis]PWJ96154.1 adenylosuccinate synthetase [Oceanotoga teriensis]UYO99936.1 adenylosuccinate synthase [Oceanotoga sp. DSM 15011]